MTKDITKTVEETSKLCDAAGTKINIGNSVLCLYNNNIIFKKMKKRIVPTQIYKRNSVKKTKYVQF